MTIDVLKEMLNELQYGKEDGRGQILIDASDENIAALTEAIEQLEWVPVTPETMPEYKKTIGRNDYEYIIKIHGALEATTGMFDGKAFYYYPTYEDDREYPLVTHWKPLPQPPAKDGE